MVRTAAKYAKNIREGSFDAGFQRVIFIQNFCNIHNIVMEEKYLKISEEK